MLNRSLLKALIATFIVAIAMPSETASLFAKKKSSSSSSSSRSSSSYKPVSSSWKKPKAAAPKPTTKPKTTAKPKAKSTDFYSRSSVKPAPKSNVISSKPKTLTSKPGDSAQPPSTKTRDQTSSGFSKPPVVSSKVQTTESKPKATAFDQTLSKKSAKISREQYLKEKGKYNSSPETASTPTRTEVVRIYEKHPIYNRYSRRGTYISYDAYYVGRNRYYANFGWEPPYYVYESQSRFGIWDAWTWWYVLDNLHKPEQVAMAYHHRYDPGYLEWRREARRISYGNSSLRTRLRRLDREVERLEGQDMIPGYLPNGMNAEVALAADITSAPESIEGVVRIATAQPGGNYFVYGQLLRSLAPETIDLEVLQTAGSQENLQKLDAGDIEAAIAQSDILGIRTLESETNYPIQAPLWDEFIHIISNKESGVQKIQDLDPEQHTICIGEAGSGSVETWRGFVMANSEYYGKFETRNINLYDARNAVLDDPNTVMLYVAGLGADFLKETDKIFGDRLQLVLVDVPEFESFLDNDDNQVYKRKPLELAYPNLQKAWGSMSLHNNLSVTAILALSSNALENLSDEEAQAFTDSARKTRDLISQYRAGK